MTQNETAQNGTYHRDICDSQIRKVYDNDLGRHVLGYECKSCRRRFSTNDRKRDGLTFRYKVSGRSVDADTNNEGIVMSDGLPDSWELANPTAPYYKLIKRNAVTVPKNYSDEPFQRDAVVVVAGSTISVVKGPGARQTWMIEDPEAAANRIVTVLEEWIAESRDPYGGQLLDEQLNEQANRPAQEQFTIDGGDA